LRASFPLRSVAEARLPVLEALFDEPEPLEPLLPLEARELEELELLDELEEPELPPEE
jgi:hypothetical protein